MLLPLNLQSRVDALKLYFVASKAQGTCFCPPPCQAADPTLVSQQLDQPMLDLDWPTLFPATIISYSLGMQAKRLETYFHELR
jgi:hypothetical protein